MNTLNSKPLLIWASRAALVATVLGMCLIGYLKHPSRYDLELSGWVNADAPRVQQILRRLLYEWGTDLAGFFAMGVVTYLSLGTFATTDPKRRVGLLAGSGLALCGLVRGVQLGHFPESGHILLPVGAFAIGVWTARAFVRGRRAVLWLVVQTATVMIVAGGVILLLGWLSLQDDPLAFEPLPPRTVGKRELADKLRGRHEGAEQARRVRLSDLEINQVVETGLKRVMPASNARFEIAAGHAKAAISLRLTLRGKPRYINVRAGGIARIDDGELTLSGHQFSIGRVGIPSPLLQMISPQVASTIRHDRDLRNIVGSIASMRLEGNTVDVLFKPGECSNTFLPALALAYSGNPNIVGPTREYVRQLVEGSEDLPAGDPRFVELIRRAFAFARTRSVDGDPVIENRSALVSLAILIGDPKVELVVGQVLDDRLRSMASRNLQGVKLRGRADWTKHFYVSAAMVLLACERASDKVGKLKEVLDAEEGGSGFSFGDMAANRAGILLARESTFNVRSARVFQDRLAAEFPIESLFPDSADLPETLTRDQFRKQYGSVHGEAYRRLIAEIDRRLATCVLLKPVDDVR